MNQTELPIIKGLFAATAENSSDELCKLLKNSACFSDWPKDDERTEVWLHGLEGKLSAIGGETPVPPSLLALAETALSKGFISPELRKCYAAWLKAVLAGRANVNAVLKAVGVENNRLTGEGIWRHWQAFKAVAPGVYAYDMAFGRMLISEYAPADDEIIATLDNRSTKRYSLEFLLSSCYVVAQNSGLNALFAGDRSLHFPNRPAFDLMCFQSLLGGSAPTPEQIYKIACRIMSETEFKALFSTSAPKPAASADRSLPTDLHKWLNEWLKGYTAIKAALKPSRGSRKAAAADPEKTRAAQKEAIAAMVEIMRKCAAAADSLQLQKQWLLGLIYLRQQKALGEEAVLAPLAEIFSAGLFTPFTSEGNFNAICRTLIDNERSAAKEIAAIFCPTILPAWDSSVSIPQLHERLMSNEQLKLTHEPNIEAVGALLKRTAPQESTAAEWAACVALLLNANLYNEQIMASLRELADSAVCWHNQKLYVGVTDKLPARLVPCWMRVTREMAGSDFLIRTTLCLPFNLWGYAENILKSEDEEENFIAAVYDDLAHRRGTPDHFYWLWKSAPVSPLREKYLSDAYLLFRALGRSDLKGNYLKSQRAIVKLMMAPEDKNGNPLPDTENYRFLCTLMRNGENAAISNLVNCVKQQPLLSPTERQTLLVQITCIYPKALAIVERGAVVQMVINRYTSPRSLAEYRKAYRNLCEVQIPANTKAIEEARSHGDLSENSEYKYAKEHARELNRRKSEMEKELNDLQVADLGNVKVGEKAVLWSVVTIRHSDTGRSEDITILGIYDGNPEKNYISYMAPLGEALLDKSVGATVKLPAGTEAVIENVAPLPADLTAYLSTEEE